MEPEFSEPVPVFEDVDMRNISIDGQEEVEVIKFNLENVRKYIDNTIRHWDQRRKNSRSARKKTQLSSFIANAQMMRQVIFGQELDL